jgi:hypothetical protein
MFDCTDPEGNVKASGDKPPTRRERHHELKAAAGKLRQWLLSR